YIIQINNVKAFRFHIKPKIISAYILIAVSSIMKSRKPSAHLYRYSAQLLVIPFIIVILDLFIVYTISQWKTFHNISAIKPSRNCVHYLQGPRVVNLILPSQFFIKPLLIL